MNAANPSTKRGRRWLGVAIALVLPTLVTLAYFVLAARYGTEEQRGTYSVAKCLQFAFPAIWAWVVLREPIRRWRPTAAGIGLGVAFGVAVFAATWLLYVAWLRDAPFFVAAQPMMLEKVRGFGLDSAGKFIVFGAFYAFGHAILEEYYFRWFLFGQLRRLMPAWPAIIVSALGFMLHHVFVLAAFFQGQQWLTVLLSLAVAVGGAFWAWLYNRSGSLAGPCISHMFVDAAIFSVGFYLLAGSFPGGTP